MNVRTVIATLLVAASVLVVPPQAQAGAADKGSMFVSGQLGLDYYLKGGSSEDAQPAGLGIYLVPRVLYFPVKSIAVGGEANLDMYSTSAYKTTSIAVGPRVAYYLKPDASHYPRGCCLTPWLGGNSSYWMPFVGVSILYLMDKTSSGSYSSTASGYRGRIGVGVAPLIGDHGTAFAELGFQTQNLKHSVATASSGHTSNQIYLEAGFGAFLFE